MRRRAGNTPNPALERHKQSTTRTAVATKQETALPKTVTLFFAFWKSAPAFKNPVAHTLSTPPEKFALHYPAPSFFSLQSIMRVPFRTKPFVPLIGILLAIILPASAIFAAPDIPPLLVAPGATPTSIRIASPEAWISAIDKPALAPTPEADNTYGYDYFLYDRQINVREQSAYTRAVYRITNANTLQAGARISWEHDPAYATLTVHHIRVIRDGVTQDRLKPGLLQTIQQERDYDRHLYDGRLTTFANLDDIRVGDIIDYAATRTGWNPVFEGRLILHQSVRFACPLRHERIRIIAPSGRTFATKTLGPADATNTVAFTKQQNGDDMIHTWETRDQPPISHENGAPGWFTQYPWVQMSEYPDWASVIRWAQSLYTLPDPLPGDIINKARELTKTAKNDSDKAASLLEFVQQEIRYLGVELGAGSYRPNPPALALSRRFGDCKDKALLYCALMRAAGLNAHPALVDTGDTRGLDERIPSPGVFNHVIVFIPKSAAGGDIATDHFVDPTITDQQGPLACRGLPDYQRALVIRPGGTRLSTITIPDTAKRSVLAKETFDSSGFGKPATLNFKITYTGLSADGMRSYLRQNTTDDVSKYYLNEYAGIYPSIAIAQNKPIAWTDDAAHNAITVEANYEIPDFWTHNEDKTKWTCEFYPKRLAGYADLPDTSKRTTPLSMGAPFHAEFDITATLPGTWTLPASNKTFDGPGFIARHDEKLTGKNQYISHSTWDVTADHVMPADMPQYMETLKKFRAALGTTLYHPVETTASDAADSANAAAPASPFRMNWLIVLVTLLVGFACFYVARHLYRMPAIPPPLESAYNPELVGLGGWLILVGIMICLSPITLFATMGKDLVWMFDLDRWESLTHHAGAAYQAGWAPALLIEYITGLVVILASVFLPVLFFKRKRRFPVAFIFLLVMVFAQHIIEFAVVRNLIRLESSPSEDIRSIGTMIGSIIRAAIWIPYALVSRRVKFTFTR